jgi:peptide/nickel transport system substrate-binding protein
MSQQKFYQLKKRAGHDVVIWSGDGGLDPSLEPRYYVAVSDESNYAVLWASWYRDRNAPGAVEPPENVRSLFELYAGVVAAREDSEQAALFSRLLDRAADEFMVIGCSLAESGIGIVHPDLRNVPEIIYDSWNYPQPGPVNPCQFYFEKMK